jgi:ABC-type dipeptide/oligopeptide/nickel transport system permease subunit
MKNLILFVHGLGGSATATWGRFAEFLKQDASLNKNWHVEMFSFPTRMLALPFFSHAPRLQLLSDGLRAEVDNRYQEFESIVLGSKLINSRAMTIQS